MTYSGGGWIRPAKRWALYLRDAQAGFPICRICGKDAKELAGSPRFLTLDHLLGRTVGGSNEPSNLRTACNICNMTRKCRPDPWYGMDDTRVAWELAQQNVEIAAFMPAARALLLDPPWWVWKLRANTHLHFATVSRAQIGLYDDRPEPGPEHHGHAPGDELLDNVWGAGDGGEDLPF